MSPSTRLTALAALLVLIAATAACTPRPPSYSSAHPDAPRSGPFWEREEQRD
jgi:hypothetical protein